MNDALKEFKTLVDQLPQGLRADWKNTNHYEMVTVDEKEYWWLTIPDIFMNNQENWQDTEDGKRLGLVMDIVEKAKSIPWELIVPRNNMENCWCAVEIIRTVLSALSQISIWAKHCGHVPGPTISPASPLSEEERKQLTIDGYYKYTDGDIVKIMPVVPFKE
jgi:hypothetical protein